ncbi:MAG: NAD(P)-dependent oxidoreductase [Planctomycetes bacterium]|nr:NAD(P)-dependent oxidoreductase [Planctomycetota bacterium]
MGKKLQEVISSDAELENMLSMPTPALVEMMKRLDGDIMILGVSGKIGPDLARTALRAVEKAGVTKKIYGVDLFPEPGSKEALENTGMELITCNLLEPDEIAKLPQIKNIVYLVGRKFGTSSNEELTWMINTIIPANIGRHFTESRIAAFSTGCVYPLVDTDNICKEEHPRDSVGEYAQSCLGRERVFEYYSKANKTPVCLIRLSYAVDLRYGVIHDIGKMVLEDKPVDIKMAYFNTIWQGDVNNLTFLTLEHCASPPEVFNITRPETVSTKYVAEQFGKYMNKKVTFAGTEGHKYFLSDTTKMLKTFGKPSVPLDTIIRWHAHWLLSDGRSLNKPTHFEENEGEY